MEDVRLHCTDVSAHPFWVYWGDPALQDETGIYCFGDLELKPSGDLMVSAMNERRMQMLLDLLEEHFGDLLGAPAMKHNPLPVTKKPVKPLQRPVPQGKRKKG